ncbi:MAG: hypothetical protein PHH94_00225 [Sphaerochaetaceae bacterium]|nr:hypothetical protein [Sphaerochaetaceae bacterium]
MCARAEKKFLLILVIAAFGAAVLCAGSLLLSSIENASLSQLQTMARSYSLPVSEDAEALRLSVKSFLSEAYEGSLDGNLIEHQQPEGEAPSSFTLEIQECSSITMDKSFIVLDGGVKLGFTSEGQTPKTLSADRIVLDMNSKILTAMGNAAFNDAEENDASRQMLLGDIVSYSWDTMDVQLSGGDVSSQRTNNEGEKVEFYATGSTISYLGGEDVVVFDQAKIATSPDDPYWSIDSAKTALLGGGDMFIFNATLKIGRVPVMWVPAFFYPGTRLVFNPAIGLASDRGMFLNTTTELYGSFPVSGASGDDASSFASLLMTDQSGQTVRDGLTYRSLEEGEKQSSIESWAAESGSYMALVADVYQIGGLFAGIQTHNSFASKKIKLDSFSGVALDPSSDNPALRYFERTSGEVNLDYLKVKFSIPYYSDKTVYKQYGNRLSTFTMDALVGTEQSFPTTAGTISQFDWTLNASASLPSSWNGKLVKKAKIDPLNVLLEFEYDSNLKKYVLDSAKLPALSTSVSGTIADISKTHEKKTSSKKSYRNSDAAAMLLSLDSLDAASGTAAFPISDLNLFTSPASSSSGSSYSNSFSISYGWDQDFSNKIDEDDKQTVYYQTDGELAIGTSLGDRLFALSDSIVPWYEYSNGTDSGRITNKLQASIPFLGLTYNMNWKIFEYQKGKDTGLFEWNSTNVSTHKLSLSLPIGRLTLSLAQSLPPLQQTLTPAVSYSYDGITAKASQKFIESGSSFLSPSLISASFGLSRGLVNFAASGEYDFSKMDESWDSLELDQSFSVYFWKDGLNLSNKLKAEGKLQIQSLDLMLSYRKSLLSLVLEGYENDAGNWALRPGELETKVNLSKVRFSFWKSRINAEISLNLDFLYSFQNMYASSLAASLDMKFSIAEFTDITFSVASQNNGFYNYFDENGKFVFSSLLSDLGRSFDFFGDGRSNTSFNLSGMKFELVHYMKDWDFHCKYNASVVLSDGSWVWEQTASFYIQWRAIPDIKVENDWSSEDD